MSREPRGSAPEGNQYKPGVEQAQLAEDDQSTAAQLKIPEVGEVFSCYWDKNSVVPPDSSSHLQLVESPTITFNLKTQSGFSN